jgi:hypothetical protein
VYMQLILEDTPGVAPACLLQIWYLNLSKAPASYLDHLRTSAGRMRLLTRTPPTPLDKDKPIQSHLLVTNVTKGIQRVNDPSRHGLRLIIYTGLASDQCHSSRTISARAANVAEFHLDFAIVGLFKSDQDCSSAQYYTI